MQSFSPYMPPNLPIIKEINKFVYSKLYVAFIAVLTVLSNALALDTYFFCAIVFLAIYIAVFGKDLSPYLPMLCFCYIVSSVNNNPAINSSSILFPKESNYLIFYLGAIVIIGMVYRFSVDYSIGFKNVYKNKPTLLVGIFILSIAYFTAGSGNNAFFEISFKNIAFSTLQIIAILVPYFILSFSVHWNDIEKDYLVFTGLCIGLAVCFELINAYAINDVIINGVPNKNLIYTGWGISNNMGSMISMMIPFAFYYLIKNNHSVFWLIILDFMVLMTVFSCSRTSILIGLLFFILGNAIVLFKANRFTKLFTVINLFILAGLIYVLGWVIFKTLYSAFINGLSSQTRIELYSLGIKTFFNAPLFGSGFYALNEQVDFINNEWIWATEINFASFFPGRWHNTIIQLLATGGLVTLCAYSFHRYQTIKLCFKHRSTETLFTALSLAILLIESLFDCHFFNIGPVLFYSVALAFIEFRIPNYLDYSTQKPLSFDKNKTRLLK